MASDGNEGMITCYACDVSFTVRFEETDAEVRYCPHCGQETVDDIEIVEHFDAQSSVFYDFESEDDL